MPTTAKYIVDNNKDGAINFKGFLVGNPFTNPIENSVGQFGSYYGHQLVPRPLWTKWADNCIGLVRDEAYCEAIELDMMDKKGDLYPYGIDWEVCLNDKHSWFTKKVLHEQLGRPLPHWYKKLESRLGDKDKGQYDPCASDYLLTYLNRADVQKALHTKPDTKWNFCGGVLYNYADSLIQQEPKYAYLCSGNYNLKMAVYSGDDDTNCGTMGTQYWMWNMTKDAQWNVTSKGWGPWYLNNQTGGYNVKWNCGPNGQNISLVTVHSAGHEVPWYKEERSLYVFENYLKGAFS